jgi:hypothetical protein
VWIMSRASERPRSRILKAATPLLAHVQRGGHYSSLLKTRPCPLAAVPGSGPSRPGNVIVRPGRVCLSYATDAGHAFIDPELYPPRSWTEDAGSRATAGVSDQVEFAAKLALARRMIILYSWSTGRSRAWRGAEGCVYVECPQWYRGRANESRWTMK